MNKFFKYVSHQINSIGKLYDKSSTAGKILLLFILLILVTVIFKGLNQSNQREGFEQSDQFLFKTNNEIYDDFYSDIYDHLVFNNVKNQYEVGEIINNTSPTSESIILDIGCGTGHHVAELGSKDLNVIGIDVSPSMIAKAKEQFPEYKFEVGDALNQDQFRFGSFTHILCLYFTIYYMKDKMRFFKNCFDWLMPGGYLIIHLVNRDQFDPILPPGNPLMLVSPQRYAKQRITTTKVKFTDFSYHADFQLDKGKNIAKFIEKFKNDTNGKVRKNEHTLYMESQKAILVMAQEAGFIIEGQIDLIRAQYEYQYLYILTKPN
uniref:Methyltransferase domain-containing protein n=1 Tax=viral metagenome TaxID=1070528 RepID=A0A6C0E3V6_9ZZZZ